MFKTIQEILGPKRLEGEDGSPPLDYVSVTASTYFLGVLIYRSSWIEYGPDYNQTTNYE